MIASLLLLLHVVIVAALVVRIIMRRPPVGVAHAWLLLVLVLPLAGIILYLLVGERRIGRSRRHRLEDLRTRFQELSAQLISPELFAVDWSRHRPDLRLMGQLGSKLAGARVVHGSELELLSDTDEILSRIARDIDAARHSVLMEFYIWNAGGLADEVLEALGAAARRGVQCLVLIDAIGARPWWKGDQPARLREAGVELKPALPVGLLRSLIGRADLRLHRKIVVIDGSVAWTGSMNLVDPRYFKQNAGVGQWVDVMARIEGAAVASLVSTLLGDWLLESGESLDSLLGRLPVAEFVRQGRADVQVIRSGPGQNGDALLHMILACINHARRDLVVTTPYLIPDEPLLQALRGAAARGVTVRLIIPERIDSFLTRHACRSYFDDLLSAGVCIHQYREGLLHTKSIRVDDDLSMFGTANLDLRSLWLNYEVSLFIYDVGFNANLARLQQDYLARSSELDLQVWARRGPGHRLLENTLRLVSPLL